MFDQLKHTSFTLILFFTLLFVYTRLTGPIPFSINSVTTTKDTAFTVSGEGEATIIPDSTSLTLGVSATGLTAKEAQDKLNSNINKVISAIKSLGIDEGSIQTQNYNLNPTYDFTTGNQKITGYNASSNVTIKANDPKQTNLVLDTAISNGATNVDNLNFDNKNRTKAEDEARKKAIENAKQKASKTANMAGFSLGKIIGYTENSAGNPPPLQTMAASSKEALTQIEPGSNLVRISITLSYQIK